MCITECYRVLKPQGRLIGHVPFLHCIHPDPDDHFRFTQSSLERIFHEAGFKSVVIEPLGFGPVTAGVSQYAQILKLRPLIFFAFFGAIGIDRLLNIIFTKGSSVSVSNFPLGYFFVAKKA